MFRVVVLRAVIMAGGGQLLEDTQQGLSHGAQRILTLLERTLPKGDTVYRSVAGVVALHGA